MNKELRTKSSEELASLIVRLKMQLLESRFRMASGELEKLHAVKEIKKTVARVLTILNERQIKITIGTHGVTMYNLKNNEVKSITADVEKIIQAANEQKETDGKKKVPVKTTMPVIPNEEENKNLSHKPEVTSKTPVKLAPKANVRPNLKSVNKTIVKKTQNKSGSSGK